MPRNGTAGAARARRRAEIKGAALSLLRARGEAAVTMRAVARACDMTASSLYRFFDDLESLLGELRSDAIDQITGVLMVARDEHRGDTAECWRAMARSFRAWSHDHPAEFALVYHPHAGGETLWPPECYESLGECLQTLAGVVADGIARGDIEPPPVNGAPFEQFDGGLAELPNAAVRLASLGATETMGHVSLEIFGHLGGLARDPDALFELHTAGVMGQMGFRAARDRPAQHRSRTASAPGRRPDGGH